MGSVNDHMTESNKKKYKAEQSSPTYNGKFVESKTGLNR